MLEIKGDRFALMKAEYEKAGPEPSNIRYGYVVPNGQDRSRRVCVESLRHSGASEATSPESMVPCRGMEIRLAPVRRIPG